jgi:Lectin C-type domain
MNRSVFGFACAFAFAFPFACALAGCDGASDPGVMQPQRPSGLAFGGHTYVLSASGTWAAAEAEAASYGGHLVAVNSQAEQDFLTASFCQAVPLWIGASDVGHKKTFTWSTGEPMSYTKWSSGEPNDWTNDEDYVAMNWHFAEGNGARGDWNDAPLAGTKGYPGTTDGPYQGILELP